MFVKGPGSVGKNRKVDKLYSQEERVEILENVKWKSVWYGNKYQTRDEMSGWRSEIQSWTHFFTDHVPIVHKYELRELYYMMKLNENGSLNAQIEDI